MPESFEERYEDVLQNIEFALVQEYRAHDDMTDFEAREALNALIRHYQAQWQNKPAPTLHLKPLAQEAFTAVQEMCEWRLGRTTLRDEHGNPIALGMTPKTLEEIIACLKRIRRSIEMWNKELGRRGYFEFVKDYVR